MTTQQQALDFGLSLPGGPGMARILEEYIQFGIAGISPK